MARFFYYFIPIAGLFKCSLGSFFEAFYFSGVTLTTLGYGDVVPKHRLCRLLSLSEAFAGILLVAVAIATYIGGSGERDASVAGFRSSECDELLRVTTDRIRVSLFLDCL
jgi:hypothetical protein